MDSGLVSSYHQADIIPFQPTFSVPDPNLDPALDPDSALFFSGFQEVDKNKFFSYYFSWVHFHQSSKITTRKTVEFQVFLKAGRQIFLFKIRNSVLYKCFF